MTRAGYKELRVPEVVAIIAYTAYNGPVSADYAICAHS